LCYRVMVQ